MKSRKLTNLDKEAIVENCLTKISDKISKAEDALKEVGVKAVKSLFPKDFSPAKEQETWYPAPTYLYFADPVTRGVFQSHWKERFVCRTTLPAEGSALTNSLPRFV